MEFPDPSSKRRVCRSGEENVELRQVVCGGLLMGGWREEVVRWQAMTVQGTVVGRQAAQGS